MNKNSSFFITINRMSPIDQTIKKDKSSFATPNGVWISYRTHIYIIQLFVACLILLKYRFEIKKQTKVLKL